MSDPKGPDPSKRPAPSPGLSSPEQGPRPTPFDNPYFLPVVLLGLGIWFAYDGWFNPEIKSVRFNRVGAVILLAGAFFTGLRAWREKQDRDASSTRAD